MIAAMGALALLLLSSAPRARAASIELASPDRERALRLLDIMSEDKSELPEAERVARKGYELDSEKAPWLLRLARIASALGRPAEAARDYRELLNAQGESAGVLVQLGANCLAADDPDCARAAFEKARTLTPAPEPLYYLSETAAARGDNIEARRWARAALKALARPSTPAQRRMQLWLRARLGWDDSIDDGFQKLFEDAPDDPEILGQWIDALLNAGLGRDAGEPVALLKERFPDEARRARLYELKRLRALKDKRAYDALLEDSVARWPNDPLFALMLGEQRAREGRWISAEPLLRRAEKSPLLQKAACLDLDELHRAYDHELDLTSRWYQSSSGHIIGEDAAYRGYPSEHLRLEGLAGASRLFAPSQSYASNLARINGKAAWEDAPWTAGADAALTVGGGEDGVSPGVFGGWQPLPSAGVGTDAYWRRAWIGSPEAAAVGARTDHVGATWEVHPLPAISFTGAQSYNRDVLNDGSRAYQSVIAPALSYRLVNRPVYVDIGYRFYGLEAWGQPAFFSRLGLIQQERTHFATLSFGRAWDCGRWRADGHLYNGQDDARRISFGSFETSGAGLALDWFGETLHLRAAYDYSRDTQNGIGGSSHAITVSLGWHRYGH